MLLYRLATLYATIHEQVLVPQLEEIVHHVARRIFMRTILLITAQIIVNCLTLKTVSVRRAVLTPSSITRRCMETEVATGN